MEEYPPEWSHVEMREFWQAHVRSEIVRLCNLRKLDLFLCVR
jgi:hypothetical protein